MGGTMLRLHHPISTVGGSGDISSIFIYNLWSWPRFSSSINYGYQKCQYPFGVTELTAADFWQIISQKTNRFLAAITRCQPSLFSLICSFPARPIHSHLFSPVINYPPLLVSSLHSSGVLATPLNHPHIGRVGGSPSPVSWVLAGWLPTLLPRLHSSPVGLRAGSSGRLLSERD